MAWNPTPNEQLISDWEARFKKTPDARQYWLDMMGDEAHLPQNMEIRQRLIGLAVPKQRDLASKLYRAYKSLYGENVLAENRFWIAAYNYAVYQELLKFESSLLKRIV